MGADYSFYVKSIATYAPTFLRYNNSVLAMVCCPADADFDISRLANNRPGDLKNQHLLPWQQVPQKPQH
jgi:hypothetical protein